MNEEGLEAVVQFCYTGSIDAVNGENVAAMLHASQRLQVEPMTRALTTWLAENLNVQSAAVVLAMADKLQIEALRVKAMEFLPEAWVGGSAQRVISRAALLAGEGGARERAAASRE